MAGWLFGAVFLALTAGAQEPDLPRLPGPSILTHAVSVLEQPPKYGEDEPFSFVNPNAPRGGDVNLPGTYFTKLSNFGLYGSPPPALELVFDNLADKSWDDDEAYTVYGVLVRYFEIPKDRRRIRLHLRRDAAFSDGVPVTARDVVFSYRILFLPGMSPAHRTWFERINRMEEVDEHTVDVWIDEYSRDVPVNLSRLTVYPEHIYGEPGADLGKDFEDSLPIGSGPYVVESFEKGQNISYRRRDDYWGDRVPRLQGTYNFDGVHYQVYYDDFSELQALKSGKIDFTSVNLNAFFNQMNGEYFDRGFIRKERFPITRPAAMHCFAFNLRRPVLQDVRMRQAIELLYDFETINRNVYWGERFRLNSYFHNENNLRSGPGPAEGEVRKILERLAAEYNDSKEGIIHVPALALERGAFEYGLDSEGERIPMEQRILAVNLLLDEMGWIFDENEGVRMRNGEPLQLEILTHASHPAELQYFAKNMRAVGIRPILVDASKLELVNRLGAFRFDLVNAWFDGRRAPSAELARNFLSATANIKGSANILGLTNPAVDAVLEELLNASSVEEMETWARVFDRIMLSNHYVVPRTWPIYDYGVYWDYLEQPEEYASGLWFYAVPLRYWWMDLERKREIEAALEGQPSVEAP